MARDLQRGPAAVCPAELRGNSCTTGHRRARVMFPGSETLPTTIARLDRARTAVEFNGPVAVAKAACAQVAAETVQVDPVKTVAEFNAPVAVDVRVRTEAGFNVRAAAIIGPDDPVKMAVE